VTGQQFPASGLLISVVTDEDVEQMLSVWGQCDTQSMLERQLFVVDAEPSSDSLAQSTQSPAELTPPPPPGHIHPHTWRPPAQV
jgi:hypothetical protein